MGWCSQPRKNSKAVILGWVEGIWRSWGKEHFFKRFLLSRSSVNIHLNSVLRVYFISQGNRLLSCLGLVPIIFYFLQVEFYNQPPNFDRSTVKHQANLWAVYLYITAIVNQYKFISLTENKCVIFQFHSSEVENKSHWAAVEESGRLYCFLEALRKNPFWRLVLFCFTFSTV